MKTKAAVALAVLAFILMCAHRALLHALVVDTVLAAVSAAGLCVFMAGLARVAGRKRPAPVTRQRTPGSRPAIRPEKAAPCSERCGRPATRLFGQWRVCGSCGGRLDEAAGKAVRRPAEEVPPAGWTPVPAAEAGLFGLSEPELAQPPVLLPEGETIGTIDMSEFEERAS